MFKSVISLAEHLILWDGNYTLPSMTNSVDIASLSWRSLFFSLEIIEGLAGRLTMALTKLLCRLDIYRIIARYVTSTTYQSLCLRHRLCELRLLESLDSGVVSIALRRIEEGPRRLACVHLELALLLEFIRGFL